MGDEAGLTSELERQTEDQVKLRFSEINFKKLKNVTGVSNIKQVIGKIEAQRETQAHLLRLVEECKAKKIASTKANEELQAELNRYKFTAPGGNDAQVLDDLEAKNQKLQNDIKVKREQLKRSQDVL